VQLDTVHYNLPWQLKSILSFINQEAQSPSKSLTSQQKNYFCSPQHLLTPVILCYGVHNVPQLNHWLALIAAYCTGEHTASHSNSLLNHSLIATFHRAALFDVGTMFVKYIFLNCTACLAHVLLYFLQGNSSPPFACWESGSSCHTGRVLSFDIRYLSFPVTVTLLSDHWIY